MGGYVKETVEKRGEHGKKQRRGEVGQDQTERGGEMQFHRKKGVLQILDNSVTGRGMPELKGP